jgi:hypothetical protein
LLQELSVVERVQLVLILLQELQYVHLAGVGWVVRLQDGFL